MAIVDQDILRVSVNFELADGTLYQNIYHWIRDGTDPISDANHIAGIKAKVETAYDDISQLVSDDVVEQLCFVDRVAFNEIVDEWRVVENIGTFTPTWVAAGGTEGLPFQTAPYVYFKTIRPRTIGKKYLFPFLETMQTNTILSAPAITAMTAYATELLIDIVLGGDATLAVGVPRTGVQSWYNFLVAVVQDVVGTQRRRKPGVGA